MMNRKEAWRKKQRDFYVSIVWIDCSKAYRKAHPFCERCAKKHVVRPSEEVHHVIELSAENINNPQITLNWDNLEALCGECHRSIKKGTEDRRWRANADGSIEFV